jgi:hypothetical protein
MTLPSLDLGLMSEHLTVHQGVIYKLRKYHEKITDGELKEIILLQIKIMSEHVRVMLQLINPNQNNYVEVPPLHFYTSIQFPQHTGRQRDNFKNKPIALEARMTAKSMANENFVSALMMKNPNARHAHIEMALQQTTIQEKYGELIKSRGWEYVPHVCLEEQFNTYQHFYKTLKI